MRQKRGDHLSNNNTNRRKQVIDNITNWLEEENVTFDLVSDSPYDIQLALTYANRPINLILDKNKKRQCIEVVAQVNFTDLDKRSFAGLKEEQRNEFLIALGYSLMSLNLTYKIYPSAEKMDFVQIRKRLFFENLDRNGLFDMLDRVRNGIELVYLDYAKYLPKPKGSSLISGLFF